MHSSVQNCRVIDLKIWLFFMRNFSSNKFEHLYYNRNIQYISLSSIRVYFCIYFYFSASFFQFFLFIYCWLAYISMSLICCCVCRDCVLYYFLFSLLLFFFFTISISSNDDEKYFCCFDGFVKICAVYWLVMLKKWKKKTK